MNMDHLLEDKNISVAQDTELYGHSVKAGAKILSVLKQGDFNGYKMRVPPPEFEALLFFTSLESAAKAEVLKNMVEVSKSEFDSLSEVITTPNNRSVFFAACQNAMASVAFAISAIESWANNSIAIHGLVDGQPSNLVLKRPNKPERIIPSDSVASDISIPIRPKLFQLVPQVFSAEQLQNHSSLKKQLGDIVDERNIIMHMQSKLTINENEFERVSYAIKLFKTNSFFAPEIVINYISYIYEKSAAQEAAWVTVAKKELKKLKKKLK